MKYLIIILLLFSACTAQKHLPKETGYLVTVNAKKTGGFSVHKLLHTADVDSILMHYYGYAFSKINTDTLFDHTPYFIIETKNSAIYGEEKAIVSRNGKIKFKKIKR